MKLIITGGCGFIGSHLVKLALARGHEVINLDALTYAANPENLRSVAGCAQYRFLRANIAHPDAEQAFSHDIDAVLNLAAESHVDKSITHPDEFVQTNIVGTYRLLELTRKYKIPRFLQVSTDEVYGSLEPDAPTFTETNPLAPSSVYSSAKASADLLTLAYHKTYCMDTIVTRCSNNYGTHQHPEKLIPLVITRALAGKRIPIYGSGLNIRDWLNVHDHCQAIFCALEQGKAGEVYNVGGNNEQTNLQIVSKILQIMQINEALIAHVADRQGHDKRYAINAEKICALGWSAKVDFEQGLHATISWYVNNR